MPIPQDMKHLHLIEDVVARHGGTIIGAIRTGTLEREGYWEKTYIVCWMIYRDEVIASYITHQANVNSEGKAALFHGHYDMTHERDALADMLERANLTVGRI